MDRPIHAWTVGRCERSGIDELICIVTVLMALAVFFTFGCAVLGMIESLQERRKEKQ